MSYPEDAQEGNFCVPGAFFFPLRQGRLSLGVVRMIHVLPEKKKLGPISWKKQEWKQSLIHSALIFLEKVLLKACLAVSSDSET